MASTGSEELGSFRFVEPVSQRLLVAVAENLPPGERTAVELWRELNSRDRLEGLGWDYLPDNQLWAQYVDDVGFFAPRASFRPIVNPLIHSEILNAPTPCRNTPHPHPHPEHRDFPR